MLSYTDARQIKQLPYLIFSQPGPFSPHTLLNKDHVQAVMIELKESFGCEGRGGYFDEFGIVRDVLQNRESWASREGPRESLMARVGETDFMQVMTMLAMDRPDSLDGDELRDEKVGVSSSCHCRYTKMY